MKQSLIGLLAVIGFFALACGFLDSEAATVTYERAIPVDFEVDANELCPTDADCEEDTVDAQEEVELLAIEIPVDIDILESTGSGDLQNISQRLRSLEITSIDYEVSDNSLTFDLPDVEVHVAPLGTRDADDPETVHLTTIPSVPAQTDDAGNAPAREQALEPASELFKELQYTAIAGATPVVKEGQPFPPSGTSDVELVINIKITANPLDDI